MSILSLCLIGMFGCPPSEEEDGEDCPVFSKYQIYPEEGDGDTQYELLIILARKEVNAKVTAIQAKVANSDGSLTPFTLDMVQSNAEPARFVRAFNGNEVCEEGTCMLFFKAKAFHASGCKKSIKTDVFVVRMPESPDDDDDATDDDDDDTTDDDDAVDDDDATDDDDAADDDDDDDNDNDDNDATSL